MCRCFLPYITTHPSSNVIRLSTNNHKLSLTCKADGATLYKWEKQYSVISSHATGVNTNTLTIINLQPEDAGNYRCVAINDCGNSYSKYALVAVNGMCNLAELLYFLVISSKQSAFHGQYLKYCHHHKVFILNKLLYSHVLLLGCCTFISKVTGITLRRFQHLYSFFPHPIQQYHRMNKYTS